MASYSDSTLSSDYEQYLARVLEPTFAEIETVLLPWKEDREYWKERAGGEHASRALRSPVYSVKVDIKKAESVVDKIRRFPGSFPLGVCVESVRSMNDAVRARVVTYFMSDLPVIDFEVRRLISAGVVEISGAVKAYMTDDMAQRLGIARQFEVCQKDSGYLSLHYNLRFTERHVLNHERPPFELQVRTLSEDLWGEIEHVLGYRTIQPMSVRRQFRVLSVQLAAIDEHFNLLHEELLSNQENATLEDQDLITAETLPGLIAMLNLTCAEHEIDLLLKVLLSRGFQSVGEVRSFATTRRLDLVRNTYFSLTGQQPGAVDVVAVLAAMYGASSDAQEVNQAHGHIKFLKAREKLKNELGLNKPP